MTKEPSIYIVTNHSNTVIYIGVTSDLKKRVWQHQQKIVDGFTKKYNLSKLVYFESIPTMSDAISREKQLKKWSRAKKKHLIETVNPEYKDLYGSI
jgi:putative endonuclease